MKENKTKNPSKSKVKALVEVNTETVIKVGTFAELASALFRRTQPSFTWIYWKNNNELIYFIATVGMTKFANTTLSITAMCENLVTSLSWCGRTQLSLVLGRNQARTQIRKDGLGLAHTMLPATRLLET